jgi:aminoglycoside phosphotransferase (APT) family kinase protein
MEFVPGHVIEQDVPREFRATAERRRLANAFIDAVAAVHRVNLEKVGLAGLARPSGYLERQLRRFSGLWEHSKTREIPAMAALEDWLRRRRPESADTTLVHGDCRLGNAIVAARAPARIAALLDWEMATIGDPLADLGYFCASWSDPTDERLPKFHLSPATASAGFPTRTELLDRYERRTGRPIVDLQWYWALALWKSAVFMEGNVRRSNEGMTSDPLLRDFSDGVVELAELGLDVARSVN